MQTVLLVSFVLAVLLVLLAPLAPLVLPVLLPCGPCVSDFALQLRPPCQQLFTPPHRHRIDSAQEHEEPRPGTTPQRGKPAAPGRIPLGRTTPPESPLVPGPEALE